MRRRTALKSITVIAAGAALFPSCSESLILTHLPEEDLAFNGAQSTWLEAISEAVLPKGDRSLTTLESLPTFVAQHLNVLSSKKDLTTFVNGYNLCTEEMKGIYESETKELTSAQIISYFTDQLAVKETPVEPVDELSELSNEAKKMFCQKMRGLSIHHLTTSKEYQEDVLEFKLVPKTYQACVNA